ncbi:hypothetical protein OC498_00480 [Acinetobacter bohemicus]|uniref:Uncharacterized protein n=1 Tax=Acinetobacter lwoffii TaxID=28090 RepID=A0A9D2UTC1_ACILW|nr:MULTISPECIES: hypothetical protein [Acinetobacter]MDM1781136.1 hypothetical protein [Acinetobacter indicus]HJF28410.1 hypothetical protein [Acinetobacter lwoffii]MCO8041235.1 hypothetical protein [Acinetobacter sp. S4400-12]MCU7223404.1 hypothetical protein [Acinetobacter bohemicus]QKQ70902.1 hypothetical protein E5Y90_12105 [Acinetobacter sp. 10FS3-1]
MYDADLNPALLAFWLFLITCIAAISTAIISHNFVLDSVAISVSVLTVAGVVISMALFLAEQIIETCSS